MEKLFLILNNKMIIQVADRRSSEFLLSSTKYVFTLICLILAVVIMVFIPVMMCYSIFVNYVSLRNVRLKLNSQAWQSENDDNSKELCDKYFKAYKNVIKNSFGLAAWNIFSIIYIITGFEDFRSGVIEYFYFPFKIFKSINKNAVFNSIRDFDSNWYNMLLIAVLTFGFYSIGTFVGNYLGKINIKKIV